PMLGEIVIARITRINPNSAYVHLDEYNKEGMIHISEVSSGWVRDIRQFIKPNQAVILKVVRLNEHSGEISLSLKRVSEKQRNEKMKEFNLNKKAEKMLEIAAKGIGLTLDKAYDEVGYLLQENFGSLYEGFRAALKNPKILEKRGIPEKWTSHLKEIAEKSIEQKEFEFRSKLFVKSVRPDGIVHIRNLLLHGEKLGLEIKYIAAPEYLVKFRTLDARKGEKEFDQKLSKIIEIAKPNVEAKYEVIS
ncbi:MAG: S1 RNA-binding domain-containing protein, partial [Candidatus Aenigmarchaeota archaeon]|nr:S1 RNA-binding domain-containing protein [Candidatus Aenigmarchaeota archaeon]